MRPVVGIAVRTIRALQALQAVRVHVFHNIPFGVIRLSACLFNAGKAIPYGAGIAPAFGG